MGKRRFLEAAARQFSGTCPAQARFLLWTLGNIEGKNEDNVNQVCYYCFQFLFPNNYRMRLLPKMKITPRIEKILNRERKNYRLSLKQTKLLKKYKESKNALLITCNSCKKTTRHNGISREEYSLKTPNMKIPSNKSTPLIRSHSGSKRGKSSSGLRTSTVGLSTRHSSRIQNKAKILSSQLKKMLNFEEDKNKKGNLKNFLLSLQKS